MTKRVSISEWQKMCGVKSSPSAKKKSPDWKLKDAEIERLRALDYNDGFELVGDIPSKKNGKAVQRKTGRVFSSKQHKQWHNAMQSQVNIMLAKKVNFDFEKDGVLEITIFFPTKRVADLTNKTDSIMDFLVDMKLIEDDNWQITGKTTMNPIYRKGVGGCIVRRI